MQILNLFVAILVFLSATGHAQNTAIFAQGRLPRAVKSTLPSSGVADTKKYAGQWKMSSWDGTYQLHEDGRCTLVDPGNPGNHTGIWFLAYDRLYLVWSWGPIVDVFRLNSNNHTVLERIDHELKNVFFQKKID